MHAAEMVKGQLQAFGLPLWFGWKMPILTSLHAQFIPEFLPESVCFQPNRSEHSLASQNDFF